MSDPSDDTTHLTTTKIESTLIEHDDATQLAPYLVIVSGQDQGKVFRLIKTRNCFGRGNDADIVLADSKVSRNHGAFFVAGERIELVDFQSTNGTYLDGVRVEQAIVGPNARIRAGNTVIKVEFKLVAEIETEERIYRAAYTDALTGVLNRRAFIERAEQEFVQARRSGKGFSILMCDVDFFKRINDRYGHLAGDQVLSELAAILQEQIRKDDLLARFGGEEFILLLRRTDAEAASDWAERVRRIVERQHFGPDGTDIKLTLSIGVQSGRDFDTATLESMINGADAALYQAKQRGRNRVVNADASGPE